MSRKSTCANVVFFGLNIAASLSSRGSGTRATPTFGCARPEAYLSTAMRAPVRMLKSVVLPTLGNPTNPNFTRRHPGLKAFAPERVYHRRRETNHEALPSHPLHTGRPGLGSGREGLSL